MSVWARAAASAAASAAAAAELLTAVSTKKCFLFLLENGDRF